jgi:hypothetical protein
MNHLSVQEEEEEEEEEEVEEEEDGEVEDEKEDGEVTRCILTFSFLRSTRQRIDLNPGNK